MSAVVVAHQLNFQNSSTPLSLTKFVVIDCETTGVNPSSDEICEIAAVKICGGSIESTFRTLINPRRKLNARIIALTGITNEELEGCPTIEQVLPPLIEFVGDSHIVGHNVRFDIDFINAALVRFNYQRLTNPFFDTLKMARRLIPGEVKDFKLSTIAAYVRAENLPTHRALDDVMATIDVFHYLIERSSALGIKGVGDLASLPTPMARRRFIKRGLAKDAPRGPGVYLFSSAAGQILYAGMSRDLKSRLNSYFVSDERRKIDKMLSQADRISYLRTSNSIEARIAEIRILQALKPEFNIHDKKIKQLYYVRISESEYAPTFRVSRAQFALDEKAFGPFTSRHSADLFCEALKHSFTLRRCNEICKPNKVLQTIPCLDSAKGKHPCFCTGDFNDIKRYQDRAKRAFEDCIEAHQNLAMGHLSTMSHFSKLLEFEKAGKYRDYAISIQKWMERFKTVALASRYNAEPCELHPQIKNGRMKITVLNEADLNDISKTAFEVIQSNNSYSKAHQYCPGNKDFFVSSPEEFRERYYTALFLARNNLLNNI